jgi:hypothetical protein
MPGIIATWKAEIGRTVVPSSQARKIVQETHPPICKNKKQKTKKPRAEWTEGWAQVVEHLLGNR